MYVCIYIYAYMQHIKQYNKVFIQQHTYKTNNTNITKQESKCLLLDVDTHPTLDPRWAPPGLPTPTPRAWSER